MLVELIVRDLGVIDELALVFGPGMTAVTGETGAGKTLIVEAIELLVGGRADPTMVRSGCDEAVVEGRFVLGDDEMILRRVVPREGRTRAYLNGSLSTVAALADAGSQLVDLHGQHDHQSLLSSRVQRAALDRFGDIDLDPWQAARKELATIEERLQALGGDERERAREIDLLRFQVRELDEAALSDPSEDGELERREDLLADAVAHQEAALVAVEALNADGAALERVAAAVNALDGRPPFVDPVNRLRTLAAELTDIVSDVRAVGEQIEDDPEQLGDVQARRRLLFELKRKYGETLADVLAYHEQVRGRLDELESRDATAAELDRARLGATAEVRRLEKVVGEQRRRAAPDLAAATQKHFTHLAMKAARLEVEVGPDPGDDVVFRLAANPGSAPLPLAKVASGGELARTMLSLRLVLTEAPDTLVFDEVDAGIGGEAAVAVGRALGSLGGRHQVLVVTHLPQVAAFADAHVQVTKRSTRSKTSTSATVLDADGRVVELARMLSGTPDSDNAKRHAEELLVTSEEDRDKTRAKRGGLAG